MARRGKQTRSSTLEYLSDVAGTPVALTVTGDWVLKGRSTSLAMYNGDEDIPRLVTGYMSYKGTDCGLLLRPVESQGCLAIWQGMEAQLWIGLDTDIPNLTAVKKLPLDGVLQSIHSAREELPPVAQPNLKGKWTGKLLWEGMTPVVQLIRKVTNYGMLQLTSDAERKHWHWKAEQISRYFSPKAVREGNAKSLKEAITLATEALRGLIAVACVTKDTTRREVLDPTYKPRAAAPRSPEDKTLKFGTKPRPQSKKGAQSGAQVPAPAPGETPVVAPAKRGRKPKAQASPALSPLPPPAAYTPPALPPPAAYTPPALPPPAATEEVNPEADKSLSKAFEDALANVLSALKS